jgi:hypothetical protein
MSAVRKHQSSPRVAEQMPMNEVFPEICSVQLGEAASGSIAIIPYPDGLLLALVTNQSVQKHLRSIVILGLNDPNYPPVVLHENWDIRSGCSYYKTPLRFEMSNKASDISTNETWWRATGVIASIQSEFFIRAAAMERGSYRYINIQTGDVFSGQLPTSYMTFGVWSIWLRDPLRELSVSLFDFDIHKHTLQA